MTIDIKELITALKLSNDEKLRLAKNLLKEVAYGKDNHEINDLANKLTKIISLKSYSD